MIDLRELWAYRELLYFLTWRDIKIRYKQTVIGVAWALIQPILTVAVFTIIFSRFAGFDTGGTPYPVFVLSGLMIWLFTHGAISLASDSFVSNTSLVTKVYFPRLIVPLSATLGGLFDLVFSSIMLVVLMAYYQTGISLHVVFAPVFLSFAVIIAMALGTLLSALNVRFRDIKFALPFLLQVWMIMSPVFYPASLLTGAWRYVFAINPLFGILEGFRSSLFGKRYDWEVIVISIISTLVISLFSLFIFRRMEDDFADQI